MENEIAEEYKKNNDSKIKNLLSNITIVHLLIIGVVILIIVSISKSTTDPKYNYVIFGVLIAIILVLYFKPSKERKILPDHVVKEIAQEALNRKVKENKEFAFDSKVYVTPYCHLVYENDMTNGTSGPVKWEVGFEELTEGSQYKKQGVISVHPYEGFITGIKYMPFGYTGREAHDRDIIPVGVVQGNMKTTDFGGQPK